MDKGVRKIKDELMDELCDISKKGISRGDLDTIYKMTAICEKICKMEAMADEDDWDEGYSGARRRDSMGRYSRDGRMDGDMSYNRGSSYARGGRRGGYSRDEGADEMIDKLEKMYKESDTERERKAIRECIEALEKI